MGMPIPKMIVRGTNFWLAFAAVWQVWLAPPSQRCPGELPGPRRQRS